MNAHANGSGPQLAPAHAHEERCRHHKGVVEHVSGRMLRGMGLVEEPHRRQGAGAAPAQAEPHVVVRVDEHGSCPQPQHAAAEPGPEQRGGCGGEGDVIADSHHAAAGRWPFCRYHAMLRSVPVGRSVAAAKPSTRCAFETS